MLRITGDPLLRAGTNIANRSRWPENPRALAGPLLRGLPAPPREAARAAQAIIKALRHRNVKDLAILSRDEYAARRPMALR
jgi:hypothetical protein